VNTSRKYVFVLYIFLGTILFASTGFRNSETEAINKKTDAVYAEDKVNKPDDKNSSPDSLALALKTDQQRTEPASKEALSTVSFNFIHYILYKFNITDIFD